MNVELTEDMKREIIKNVSNQIFQHIKDNRMLNDIGGMAKEKAAKDIASTVSGTFHQKVNVEDVVSKAIVDFETRINKRIEKTLAKGITVKLAS